MSEDKLQKRVSENVKEKAQYVLAFGVIAGMLVVAQFPMFVIVFFGIFAYFLWRTFSSPPVSGVRGIFDFYVDANNILRDDERRFFGYEINEVISRGEMILKKMNGAPPLIYFTIGALYNRVGNHEAAVRHLSYILENGGADEVNYVYATPELRNYVNVLRKIENQPTEAPLSVAALRALERARRTRGKAMLENSRRALKENSEKNPEIEPAQLPSAENQLSHGIFALPAETAQNVQNSAESETQELHFLDISEFPIDGVNSPNRVSENAQDDNKEIITERKPISEVLRDIYDK